MKKYLLSNGLRTIDKTTYIKDMLTINLATGSYAIPYNKDIGMDLDVDVVSQDDYVEVVRTRLTDLLEKLATRHNVTISLKSLEMESNKLVANIKLNKNEDLQYEIN
jgi:hypothetical protein